MTVDDWMVPYKGLGISPHPAHRMISRSPAAQVEVFCIERRQGVISVYIQWIHITRLHLVVIYETDGLSPGIGGREMHRICWTFLGPIPSIPLPLIYHRLNMQDWPKIIVFLNYVLDQLSGD